MLEDLLIPIIGILAVFGTVFGVVYLYLTTRHKERMALIEHGRDASLFAGEGGGLVWLKWALLLVGLSAGLLLGDVLAENGVFSPGVAYTAMAMMFGGLGLVAGLLVERQRQAA